jgi:hypothetical protein
MAAAGTDPPILLPAFAQLDDATLLAHFRASRPVFYFPVPDLDETRPEKIAAIMSGRFEFNGETHALPDPVAWLYNPSRDVEWHIMLHKFYYAVGLGMAFAASGDPRYVWRWMELIDCWIARTPPGFIAADVTGRRVQNWIYSYHYFVTDSSKNAVCPAFHRRLLESIHEQVEYLCDNLTAARNHRTLELYAIFLAAVVFPEMRRSDYWREFALERIADNIRSDLLPDGVQCELSTDYHQLVLKNYLNVRRLAALNDIPVPADMDAAIIRALEFSLHAHKPDGIVPSLSDGDARSFLELLGHGADLYGREDFRYVATAGREGTPPARRVAHFADSGYTIVRSHWGESDRPYADAHYLIFDCGPLGAGNHGHFDCLNFEFAANGRSLVVDPGRYTYSEAGDPNWRVRFRGTAAHNTVCVDGLNQTLYLPRPIKEPSRHAHGAVRHKVSGPAPDAELRERFEADDFVLLHGVARSHVYDAVHSRRIVQVGEDYWIVSDWLDAPTEHEYALRFQLGEAAQNAVSITRDRGPLVCSPGLIVAQPQDTGIALAVEDSFVSYRYGERLAAPRLCFTARGTHAAFDTVLLPWRDDAPPLRIVRPPVECGADRSDDDFAALCIESARHGQDFRDLWLHSRSGAAGEWRIGPWHFHGRWLWLREDADGRILRARGDAAATLMRGDVPVPLDGCAQ